LKDNKIFKNKWFWVVIAILVLGAIGSFTQSSDTTGDVTRNNIQESEVSDNTVSTLPELVLSDYKDEEGLVVYQDLKARGYEVDAEFEKQALTDINGKASDVFEQLDPNKTNDRRSVDAFVVGSLTQDGSNVKLAIIQSSN